MTLSKIDWTKFTLALFIDTGPNAFWATVTRSDIATLAALYLAGVRNAKAKGIENVDCAAMTLDYTAPLEIKLDFIREAVRTARGDGHLQTVAAGSLEHLLAWHGEEALSVVEAECLSDPKYLLTLTGVWRHKMTDTVWAKVQALQKKSIRKLPEYRPGGGSDYRNKERVERSEAVHKAMQELLTFCNNHPVDTGSN